MADELAGEAPLVDIGRAAAVARGQVGRPRGEDDRLAREVPAALRAAAATAGEREVVARAVAGLPPARRGGEECEPLEPGVVAGAGEDPHVDLPHPAGRP